MGFEIQERHLRVDKFYSLPTSEKGNCGYAAAHYTERYNHPNGSKKTLHVYFSENGTYYQITHSEANENVMRHDSEVISPFINNCINANADEALKLYEELNHIRATRWLEKTETADELDELLTQLSSNLEDKKENQLKYV